MKNLITIIMLCFFALPVMAAEIAEISSTNSMYEVETDACVSKDMKEMLVGNFIIVAQDKTHPATPGSTDLHAAHAALKLNDCRLMITFCKPGSSETGEVKQIHGLADKIRMWKVETITKDGQSKEHFLQMTTDLGNYPVLHGWTEIGGESKTYEFWRFDQNNEVSCP